MYTQAVGIDEHILNMSDFDALYVSLLPRSFRCRLFLCTILFSLSQRTKNDSLSQVACLHVNSNTTDMLLPRKMATHSILKSLLSAYMSHSMCVYGFVVH